MFDIGFWELILVAIIALLVVGPERLPGFARETGLWINRLRRMITQVRRDLESEFRLDAEPDLGKRIADLDELMQNAPDRQTGPDTPPAEDAGNPDRGPRS